MATAATVDDGSGTANTQARLTVGPVRAHLVSMTVPMVWGILAVIGFNLVDTYFVAQLGTDALAAISFTFPVVFVLGSVALGLGAGTASVVARAIGAGDRARVQRLATDALVLAVVIVAVLVVVGLLTIDPLFTAMGASPAVLPLIHDYMAIWYLGMVFLVVPMVGNAIIRATGDTRFPSYVMMTAAGVNVVLDPILIFGWFGMPRLEIEGAAIATVIARAVTLVAAVAVLHYRERLLTARLPSLAMLLDSWREVLVVGLPAAGSNVVLPVTAGIVTGVMAGFGPEAVAAFGVAGRVEAFALIPLMALSSVMSPFTGQNWGARQPERVREGVVLAFAFCAAWGVGSALFLAAVGPVIVPLFDDDPTVIALASAYLWIVPVSYAGHGAIMVAAAAFNGLRRPLPGTVINVGRSLLLFVPLAFLLAPLGPLWVFAAAMASNVAGGIAAWLWTRRACWGTCDGLPDGGAGGLPRSR